MCSSQAQAQVQQCPIIVPCWSHAEDMPVRVVVVFGRVNVSSSSLWMGVRVEAS